VKDRILHFVPEPVLGQGPDAAISFLHDGSPLGTFMRLPGVRRTIAEDHLVSRVMEDLEAPDFLEGEELLINQWKAVRSGHYARIEVVARESLQGYANLAEPVFARRFLLRMAAFRRLDALLNGRETYSANPELGGEPYIDLELPGHPDPLHIGRVAMATYTNDPRRDNENFTFCTDPVRLELAERALEPLCPPGMTPEAWVGVCARREDTRPFLAWETSNSVKSSVGSNIFDYRDPPSGIMLRKQVADMIAITSAEAVLPLLYWVGLSPFLTQPAAAYLSSRNDQVFSAAIRDGLTKNFMLRCPALRAAVTPTDADGTAY